MAEERRRFKITPAAEDYTKEMMETEDPNLLFIAGHEDKVIKGLCVKAASLNGETGPEIFPGAEDNVVIAAFSDEFVQFMIDKVQTLPEHLQDTAWEMFLTMLADDAGTQAENKKLDRNFELN